MKRRLDSLKKDNMTTWKTKPEWPQLDLFLCVYNEYLPNKGGKQMSPSTRTTPQVLFFGGDQSSNQRLSDALLIEKHEPEFDVDIQFMEDSTEFLDELKSPDKVKGST
jgi:hypothetical protein